MCVEHIGSVLIDNVQIVIKIWLVRGTRGLCTLSKHVSNAGITDWHTSSITTIMTFLNVKWFYIFDWVSINYLALGKAINIC